MANPIIVKQELGVVYFILGNKDFVCKLNESDYYELIHNTNCWRVTHAKNKNKNLRYIIKGGMGNYGYGLHENVLKKVCRGLMIDHINRDGLDNTRPNLRFCTRSENNRNRVGKRGDSGIEYKNLTITSVYKGDKRYFQSYFYPKPSLKQRPIYIACRKDINEVKLKIDQFLDNLTQKPYGEYNGNKSN